MLRIAIAGQAPMALEEILAQLLVSIGVGCTPNSSAHSTEIRIGDMPDATWCIGENGAHSRPESMCANAAFCLREFHPHSAANVTQFAVGTLAADCRYHLLMTRLHARAQRIEMWGDGFRFAEATLPVGTEQFARAAFAALLTTLRVAELRGLEHPLPSLLACLSAFESRKAARFVAAYRGVSGDSSDGRVVYQSLADAVERALHTAELSAVWSPASVTVNDGASTMRAVFSD